MRFNCFVLTSLGLAACATTTMDAPVQEKSVNPVIQERIEARLKEGREKPAPDVRDIPSEGPAIPSREELHAEREALLKEQAELATQVSKDRALVDSEELTRKAEALKALIERDRALIAAERKLSENLPEPSGNE